MTRDEALKTLRAAGLRLTGPRRAILEALLDAAGPLSAEDVHAHTRAAGPSSDLSTVYRNLNAFVEAGLLDQREALHHEERHLVSNFVGTSDMRIEIGPGLALNPRDTVLLASDGLMDNVHLDEITEMIRKGPLKAAAASLINLARRRMTIETQHQPSKPDDLSVILFRKPYKGKTIRTSRPPSG